MLYESERLELKTKALLLLVPLFDVNVLNQIIKFRTLFLRFCINDKRAQKYLLGGIEQLIQTHKDVLLPKTAHIMKALYDEDTVDLLLPRRSLFAFRNWAVSIRLSIPNPFLLGIHTALICKLLKVRKVSKGKVFNIVQVQQIVNSIQTHGLGILNYAVSKQLL